LGELLGEGVGVGGRPLYVRLLKKRGHGSLVGKNLQTNGQGKKKEEKPADGAGTGGNFFKKRRQDHHTSGGRDKVLEILIAA